MILLGLGANLPSAAHGPPAKTLEAALEALPAQGIKVLERSNWYESPPVPASDQPWYTNGAAVLETVLSPRELLAVLHRLERALGRERRERWAARIVDLDLLAYGDLVTKAGGDGQNGPILPHPRLHDRGFVLLPLLEVAPQWRHPALGQTVREMAENADLDPQIRPLQAD